MKPPCPIVLGEQRAYLEDARIIAAFIEPRLSDPTLDTLTRNGASRGQCEPNRN
ncbi:hypothetical protein NG726_02520 [Pseudomonas sp. MOB-449]|nr:hypothetical protein [Pseudomonas sp. MOB-449]